MSNTLAKKLQLKPGQQLAVRDAPQGYFEELHAALEGAAVAHEAGAPDDARLIFVRSLEEAQRLGIAAARDAGPDCLLWIAYPKATARVKPDVNRDKLWKAMEPSGWRPVRQVTLDENWSAMRFRPSNKVGN